MQRTLVILKPIVMQCNMVGAVLRYFDDTKFKQLALVQKRGSEHNFRKHMAELSNDELAEYTKSDCIFAVYEGDNVIQKIRTVISDAEPAIQSFNMLPATESIFHSSNSVDSAERELKIWFPELCANETPVRTLFDLLYTGC